MEQSLATEIAPRIVVDPEIRSGRPVIQGTRVPIDLILGQLAGGMTVEEVAREYALSVDDVFAVLRYAADIIASEEVRATR